ncbi:permease [Isosphaera pallida ATCC 43644]|uniref:Permease n=2 Tax=Isosphaera pallida TaxID=128 RepID=E8QZ03_ISOPI|nr:permease [Isosphaera pallida ATCC 43644]
MTRRDWSLMATFVGIFLFAYFIPLSNEKVTNAILEAFKTLQWYARNHTLACVVPALFIAGAIATFLSKEAVLRHLGPKAGRAEAYSVASVSGTVLAVCSCSVLPMFAGIYRVGAGLGPATTFLYSGPALNILAIFLTARVLGWQLGIARTIGAIAFGVIIGMVMAWVFKRDEQVRAQAFLDEPETTPRRTVWQNVAFFSAMMAFLIFSDWFNPGNVVITKTDGTVIKAVLLQETRDQLTVQVERGPSDPLDADRLVINKDDIGRSEIASLKQVESWVMTIYGIRWWLAGAMGVLVSLMSWRWFDHEERVEWMRNTWEFTKLLVPLLFGGVFVVGFLGALIPDETIGAWVGDNSFQSNLISSVVGCLFYFATLTEVPILQALMRHGMADGPALAMLLAGPALSLPSILVIRTVLGWRKTVVFVALTVVMATLVGMLYGGLAS